MDSFRTNQLFRLSSPKGTNAIQLSEELLNCKTPIRIFKIGNMIVINDPVISDYINLQCSSLPPLKVCQSIYVPITKVGTLENISMKMAAPRNKKKYTDLRTQYIFRKPISSQIQYILNSIGKYWPDINFSYYDYDIFEIDAISKFYIIERHVKDKVKGLKRTLDCDEIVQLFIHNDIVLKNTDDSNDEDDDER
jgi:hypothetical protein